MEVCFLQFFLLSAYYVLDVNYPMEYVNVMDVLQILVMGMHLVPRHYLRNADFCLKKVRKEFEAISDDYPDARPSSPEVQPSTYSPDLSMK